MSSQGWSPSPDPGQPPAYAPQQPYGPSPYGPGAGQFGPVQPYAQQQGGWRGGIAIAALAVGIGAIVLGWIFDGLLGIIAGIVAVVFGVLGLRSMHRTMSLIGLILGAVAIVGYIVFLIIEIIIIANSFQSAP